MAKVVEAGSWQRMLAAQEQGYRALWQWQQRLLGQLGRWTGVQVADTRATQALGATIAARAQTPGDLEQRGMTQPKGGERPAGRPLTERGAAAGGIADLGRASALLTAVRAAMASPPTQAAERPAAGRAAGAMVERAGTLAALRAQDGETRELPAFPAFPADRRRRLEQRERQVEKRVSADGEARQWRRGAAPGPRQSGESDSAQGASAGSRGAARRMPARIRGVDERARWMESLAKPAAAWGGGVGWEMGPRSLRPLTPRPPGVEGLPGTGGAGKPLPVEDAAAGKLLERIVHELARPSSGVALAG